MTGAGEATHPPQEGNEKPFELAGPCDDCEGDRSRINCLLRTERSQGPGLVLELQVNCTRQEYDPHVAKEETEGHRVVGIAQSLTDLNSSKPPFPAVQINKFLKTSTSRREEITPSLSARTHVPTHLHTTTKNLAG